MVCSVMPPARYITGLCHQIWPSEDVIPQVKVPILFLSGLKDEIVPYVFPLSIVSRVPYSDDSLTHKI